MGELRHSAKHKKLHRRYLDAKLSESDDSSASRLLWSELLGKRWLASTRLDLGHSFHCYLVVNIFVLFVHVEHEGLTMSANATLQAVLLMPARSLMHEPATRNCTEKPNAPPPPLPPKPCGIVSWPMTRYGAG